MEERALEEYMLHSSDIYFGLSPNEARSLAYSFGRELKKVMPQSWHDNRKAGRDWFFAYMKRHQKLSMRLPEATSLARATAFNRSNVELFFKNIDKVIEKVPYLPHNVWNIDETGVPTVQKPHKVVSRRGRKQVGQITSAERGENISMALAVNAAGTRAPPYIIFPRARFASHMLNGGPPGAWGNATPTGFMNGPLFLDFITKFQQHIRCSVENPIILFMDNHVSHRTFEVLKFCRENGIHVVSFPPHTSHRLQPLDITVFGPFTNCANQFIADWLKSNPGRTMTIHDMAPIINNALQTAATERNIISGFGNSGVLPLNRQHFQDIDFMPAATTDRPYNEVPVDANADTNNVESWWSNDNDDIPMASVIVELPHNRSQQSIDESDVSDGTEDLDHSLPKLGQSSTPQGSLADLSTTLENLAPFPKAGSRKQATRGRKAQKSAVLTSDEHFDQVQQEKEAKEAKIAAAEKRKETAKAKKDAADTKKIAVAAKKLLKETNKKLVEETSKKRKVTAPSRISKRRKTVGAPTYTEAKSSTSDSE